MGYSNKEDMNICILYLCLCIKKLNEKLNPWRIHWKIITKYPKHEVIWKMYLILFIKENRFPVNGCLLAVTFTRK